jgi:hypothetical protein
MKKIIVKEWYDAGMELVNLPIGSVDIGKTGVEFVLVRKEKIDGNYIFFWESDKKSQIECKNTEAITKNWWGLTWEINKITGKIRKKIIAKKQRKMY